MHRRESRNDIESLGAILEIVCFSHLRWNFVYQRPQHLLTRFGQKGHVHFWEEAVMEEREQPDLSVHRTGYGVDVVTPLLPRSLKEDEAVRAVRGLLNKYLADRKVATFTAWYYTPMALQFSDHLSPSVIVYDCMDELSAFQGAPPALIEEERRLFDKADVVFVGGASLYESKRKQHENAHFFPSSIDRAHFITARMHPADPEDQADIPHPRIGFYGVLDERLDRELLQEVAALHSEWHFVLIGPVVKIRHEELPRGANLHYLGQKSYEELPAYLGNWDVAMLPFARNASTRFISPTKTPEYLAGGRPVVSTPIQDVVDPYGKMGVVHIARDAEEFSEAILLSLRDRDGAWLRRVDALLGENSWNKTFEGMWKEIQRCMPRDPAHLTENETRS
jgi:glycosyl transferase family 1